MRKFNFKMWIATAMICCAVVNFSSCKEKEIMYKLGSLEQQLISQEKDNAKLLKTFSELKTLLDNAQEKVNQTEQDLKEVKENKGKNPLVDLSEIEENIGKINLQLAGWQKILQEKIDSLGREISLVEGSPILEDFDEKFASKEDLENLKYEIPSIEGLASKDDIPSLQNLPTKEDLELLKNNIEELEKSLVESELITKQSTGTYLEYDWVDLGTNVLWATCNVGAKKPWEYGQYFAWGETKGCYKNETHSFEIKNYFDIKFIIYNNEGGKTELDAVHDAATQNMGGNWRMPTREEIEALTKICTSKWTEMNGVKGHLFTSLLNGNTIFLPAAGQHTSKENEDIVVYAGQQGYYWSKTLKYIIEINTIKNHSAHLIYFTSDDVFTNKGTLRYYGYTVRGVFDKRQ